MNLSTRSFCLALACGLWSGSALVIQSQTYTFTTIAGSPGVNGTNDGVNVEARFYCPSEIAVDQAGVVYVCDFLNHAIRKVDPTSGQWQVSTIAGLPGTPGAVDGTNSEARFNRPCGIEVDGQGNLYVTDLYNHLVRKIAPVGADWVVTTLAGAAGLRGTNNGVGTDARFWSPRGMARDQSGGLYVADSATHIIRKISPEGTNWVVTTPVGEYPYYGFVDETNEWAEFNTPFSICAHPDGTLFVSEWGNHAIRQITRYGGDWVTTTVAGTGDPGNEDGSGSEASFNFPAGLDVDAGHTVYVSDQSNHTVRRLLREGNGWIVSTIAGLAGERGSIDGVGTEARFNKPWGVAVDSVGNLYIADYQNHTIRMGILQGVTPPVLHIVLAAGEIVLSWPSTATDYVLETGTSLEPGGTWEPITEGILVSGDSFVASRATTAVTALFRLRRQ